MERQTRIGVFAWTAAKALDVEGSEAMLKLPKFLKLAALTNLGGLALIPLATTAASAHYSYVRCDRDGDQCWRIRCDDDGDDCQSIASFHRYLDRPRARWICDEDGDDCHRTYFGGCYRYGLLYGYCAAPYRVPYPYGRGVSLHFGWGDDD